jgi:RecJ-like exonuclease
MPKKVGILTHTDTDGVCAAAIAKIRYPDAYVEFCKSAYELASRLRALPAWDTVIILDLGLNVTQKIDLKNAFKEASKSHKIIYIDHHLIPPGITRKTLPCHVFVHRTNVSCSELALDFFKPPVSLQYIALLGAIGDYQEHTKRMRRLVVKYGWRLIYLEEFLLEQAIEASRKDHPFKRKVVQGLVQGLWPSDIPGLMGRAGTGAKRERKIESYVRENVQKISRNMALVTDAPFMATGLVAFYAAKVTDAEIGIGAYQSGGYIRFSMRRDEKSDLNLNTLVIKTSSKISGSSGGGHSAAAGGIVPMRKFKIFLRQLEREMSS